MSINNVKNFIKPLVPTPLRRWMRRQQHRLMHWRRARFDSLWRLKPYSDVFGLDTGGLPVDRYYIDGFIAIHMADIKGRVLEIADNRYTLRFGEGRVTQSDVLHVMDGNPKATIVADLTRADHIPSNTFDCIICTQTLQCIYDMPAAIRTLYRILKPGGVILVTSHGIGQLSRRDVELWGEYWRMTTLSIKKLFEEVFLPENIEVKAYGNVLSTIAFLHGLVTEDLQQKELDYHDPNYEMLITLRAVK